MTGGLIQLSQVGAQNEYINGNPSMTHFRAVYRKHTNFAMEHIRMGFTSSNLSLSPTTPRTLSCRIDRYAQILHDIYLVFTLPDIWSPLVNTSGTSAVGYEFQWIKNIGYNLIEQMDITINGQAIQTLRGEWLKFYSYMTHDKNKRRIVDEMVGNVPELYDPANSYGRINQYPHAVRPVNTPSVFPQTKVPEPSIRSRQLIIPLHFWFCENPGLVLPLVALQNSEIYVNITLRPLSEIYTIIDPTTGTRVRPNTFPLSMFLSPPLTTGLPSNPALTNFFPDPYIEGNFIFMEEEEMTQVALSDQVFLIRNNVYVPKEGNYGPNNDIVLPSHNLTARVVYACQRSDKALNNDWDNYTNWDNPDVAPFTAVSTDKQLAMYSSGQQQIASVYPRDPIVDGTIFLNGKERFATKRSPFFNLLQMYKHSTGSTPDILPGVSMYSFGLYNDVYQPSGALNASMFDKFVLRLTLQQPLITAAGVASQSIVTILKSSAFNPNPVVVTPAMCALRNPDGSPLYPPETLLTVVQTNNGDSIIFNFTYNALVYVETINFLRIMNGVANLVFAS
jgi:hypothetical protein